MAERIDGFGSVAYVIVGELRGEKRAVRVAPALDGGEIATRLVGGAVGSVLLHGAAGGQRVGGIVIVLEIGFREFAGTAVPSLLGALAVADVDRVCRVVQVGI